MEQVVDLQLKQEFWRKDRSELMEMQKRHPEYLVSITTHNFELQANTITLRKEVKVEGRIYSQQLLINAAVGPKFTFTVRINKTKRSIINVGVVDKVKQKEERTSILSGHTVCFGGYSGWLSYGEDGKGK
jgi:hypothetical protein